MSTHRPHIEESVHGRIRKSPRSCGFFVPSLQILFIGEHAEFYKINIIPISLPARAAYGFVAFPLKNTKPPAWIFDRDEK